MESETRPGSVWQRLVGARWLRSLLAGILSVEVVLHIALSVVSPHAPDASAGALVELPSGHGHGFYVTQPVATVIALLFVQFLVTALALVPLWMASHPTD